MPWSSITDEPIRPEEVLERVGASEDGAALLFLGIVRDHNEGRSVEGLHYDAYPEMARNTLATIAEEAAGELGTDRIAVVHRIGELEIGDVSVAIAVSSPHRAQAYQASRFIIEEIKKRLPIWKKERYVEGDEGWVEGVRPPTGDRVDRSAGLG